MEHYRSFSDWWGCVKGAAFHLCKGAWMLLQVIFLGIWSILVLVWRKTVKAVGEYPSSAVVVFLAALFFTWLFTFVNMRARAVGAEDRRDALLYELERREMIIKAK